MYKILAVSGGIDSVVMLHLFREDKEAVVAHFNHGIRENSNDDEEFVKKLANAYSLPFYSAKANLGKNCSEAKARERRYDFLNRVALENKGKVYTAHHKNDLYESVAINLLRGTGWRGLVPLDDSNIVRPLINWTKQDIYRYAARWQLSWRQDQSNCEAQYLRNRVREQFLVNVEFNVDKREALDILVDEQRILKAKIDDLEAELMSGRKEIEREWFRDIDDTTAIELLRAFLAKENIKATRPELKRFLLAIRHYPTNSYYNLPKDRLIKLRKNNFVLK